MTKMWPEAPSAPSRKNGGRGDFWRRRDKTTARARVALTVYSGLDDRDEARDLLGGSADTRA
jgi:hypothetical protein